MATAGNALSNSFPTLTGRLGSINIVNQEMESSHKVTMTDKEKEVAVVKTEASVDPMMLNVNESVIATTDFPGRSSHCNDLPFQKGALLIIMGQTEDPYWFMARKRTGEQGLIPASYVEKRKKKTKDDKKLHEAAIQAALKDVEGGMALRAAGRKYDVPESSIRRRRQMIINGETTDKGYCIRSIFTRAQEQALSNHIADMAAAGEAMTKRQIMEVARNMAVTLKSGKKPCKGWWRSFCRRNTQYRMKVIRQGLERGKVYPIPVSETETSSLQTVEDADVCGAEAESLIEGQGSSSGVTAADSRRPPPTSASGQDKTNMAAANSNATGVAQTVRAAARQVEADHHQVSDVSARKVAPGGRSQETESAVESLLMLPSSSTTLTTDDGDLNIEIFNTVPDSSIILREPEPQQVISIELPREETTDPDSTSDKISSHDQGVIDKCWGSLQAKLLSDPSLVNSKRQRSNRDQIGKPSTKHKFTYSKKDLLTLRERRKRQQHKRKSTPDSVNDDICDLPVKKSAEINNPPAPDPPLIPVVNNHNYVNDNNSQRTSSRLKKQTYKYKHYQLKHTREKTRCSCGGSRDNDKAIMDSYLVRLKKLPDDVKAYVHLQMSQILFNAENPHLPQQHVTPYIPQS